MIRPGFKLLGLCAVILATLMFSAGAARAESGAKWLILTSGGQVKDAASLKASVGWALENSFGSIRAFLLGVEVEIVCSGSTLQGVFLEGSGSVSSGSKATFTGCTVSLEGTPEPECTARSAGQPLGTIQTLETKGLIVLSSGKPRVRIEPKTGTTFVTVQMGEMCPIGESVPITGKLVIEDKELTTHLITHLFKESGSSTLSMLKNPAFLSGSTNAILAGEHSFLLWSGEPA